MADEKNIDVQTTGDELNDEALKETSGGSITNISCDPSSALIGIAAQSPLPFRLLGRCPRGNASSAVAQTLT